MIAGSDAQRERVLWLARDGWRTRHTFKWAYMGLTCKKRGLSPFRERNEVEKACDNRLTSSLSHPADLAAGGDGDSGDGEGRARVRPRCISFFPLFGDVLILGTHRVHVS